MPGHWEGDLVFGKHMSPVATLVERSTRFVMLVALPDGTTRPTSSPTPSPPQFSGLPAQLAKSLTWDQGHEMAQHDRFTAATGVRGLLLRPQVTLAARQQREHQRPATPVPTPTARLPNPHPGRLRRHRPRLNERPRQTLGFKTPSQALAEVLR